MSLKYDTALVLEQSYVLKFLSYVHKKNFREADAFAFPCAEEKPFSVP